MKSEHRVHEMGFRQKKIESNTVFKVLEIRLCIVKKVISISNLLWYKNYYMYFIFSLYFISGYCPILLRNNGVKK